MNRRDIPITLFGLGMTTGFATIAKAGAPPRRPVIPIEVIKEFRMEPVKEYGFTVRGEDGQDYGIDDCLRVLFEISRQHWQRK